MAPSIYFIATWTPLGMWDGLMGLRLMWFRVGPARDTCELVGFSFRG